jgi:hypothetical protein
LGVVALVLALQGCGTPPNQPPGTPHKAAARFVRVTQQAGLDFRHTDGESGKKLFPEVMGPGCAIADFTGDGRPDIYLVNGCKLTGASPTDPPARDRFYRNDGAGRFTDVTEAAGLGDPGYGMGCCAGDFDNDGRLDLYVTNLGRNTLYRNLGNGKFANVTRTAGVGAGGFCTAAAFADYDGDGHLDLYVCRYVQWTPETDVPCLAPDGAKKVRVYCRPSVYAAASGTLYHNNGDGTFTDRTQKAGLKVKPGRGLGCLWADVNEDGAPDLFVANDMSANFLFINQGNGTFREEALRRGVALGEGARAFASMGVAATDYDGDGHLDLACTNFSNEYLALYRNLGDGIFEDVSAQTGLVEATAPYVGFGLGFPDLDLDGRPDLFLVNGHVTEAAEYFYPNVKFAQPSLSLLNEGSRGFVTDAAAGNQIAAPRVSRGVAFADYDEDGDLDVLVANWRGEPDLLRNEGPLRGSWLRLNLVGRTCNRAAIGARVEVVSGGRIQVQEVRSGSSYCSQSELPLTFGLGSAHSAETIRIRWPGGKTETWSNLETGKIHVLKQR